MERALQGALLVCLAIQVAALEGASLGGMNLLSGRYFVSIAIPAVLFVSVTLVRARAGETVVAILTVFALATGAMLGASERTTGSFAGIPVEGWRGAVADLTMRIRDER